MNSRRRNLSTYIQIGFIFLFGIPILVPDKLLSLRWHSTLLSILLLLGPLNTVVAASRQFVGVRCPPHSRQTHRRLLPSSHSDSSSPLTWLITTLLFALLMGLIVSCDRTQSVIVTGYTILGITLYSALIRIRNTAIITEQITWLLVICGLGMTLLTPFIMVLRTDTRFFNPALIGQLQRFQLNLGETVHPNVLAGAIVILIPVTIALLQILMQRSAFRLVLLFALVLSSMIFVVLLTQSRGGLLALGAILAVQIIAFRPRLVAAFLILGIIGTCIIWLCTTQFRDIIPTVLIRNQALEGRILIWKTALSAIADFPFTGIGIGTFTTVIPLLYPLSFPIESYPHAHNLFLQIALDLGLPGLIAYLALLINLITMLIVTLRSAHRRTLVHTLAIGAAGSLTAFLVHGILDAVLWGTKLSFLPWLLFALITQLFLYTQQQHYQEIHSRPEM